MFGTSSITIRKLISRIKDRGNTHTCKYVQIGTVVSHVIQEPPKNKGGAKSTSVVRYYR